jgi:hypothetical protein
MSERTIENMLQACGLRSMKELEEAERELVAFGLIRVNVDPIRKMRGYTLLNPLTGEPLRLGGSR